MVQPTVCRSVWVLHAIESKLTEGTKPAATLENLSRLASKPGVQSTLILSKSDGSIIRSTGLLAATPSSSSQDLSAGNGTSHNDSAEPVDAKRSVIGYPGSTEDGKKGKSAEDVARMVFAFVAGAKAFTESMDKLDEIKLLRLRTRKNEIVIVPGMSFYRCPLSIILRRIDRSEISARCHT